MDDPLDFDDTKYPNPFPDVAEMMLLGEPAD